MHGRDDMHEQLGGEDASWLHMENAENPMVINALLEMGGVLDVDRVRSLVRERALPERFRARVVEPIAGIGVPALEIDPTFALDAHVVHVELEPGEESILEFVGATASTLLDKNHPLWRLYVVDRKGSPSALFFRAHHALADGFALLDLLLSLCDERRVARSSTKTRGGRIGGLLRQGEALGRLVALPSDPRTILKNPLGSTKRVAWSSAMSLARIKSLGRPESATLNDVLVSAIAGAIGRQLGADRAIVSDLHAMVPVNLRRRSDAPGLGNHFGLVVLALPVGLADARARLREVKRRMDELKRTPEAVVALDILRAMGHAPRAIEDAGVAFFGKKASLVLTNVPGPRTVLHIDGVPIDGAVFWVPQAARMGLGISIFSYAERVTIGVLADANVVAHPRSLVEDIERELAELSV